IPMKRWMFGALCALAPAAYAAGPNAVGTIDRALWPEATTSPAAFDRASRAEILAFAQALAESDNDDDATLKARLGIKDVDRASLDRVRARLWQTLARNYANAAKSCVPDDAFCAPAADADALRQLAVGFTAPPDAKYRAWYDSAATFHRAYRDELLRLAALFGRTNSEIDTLNANERRGEEVPDKRFELTFDDGPSRVGGTSDGVAAMLKDQHLSATFYVLGERLDERVKANGAPGALYAGQCVGMHGWTHKSHARWDQWQDSVERVTALVKATVPDAYVPLFRPPYGQRTTDSGAWFGEKGLQVALWNIDSQDWSAKIDADQVGGRVLTLMLLWRHGVVLFHDVHAKAAKAVPWIVAQTKGSGIVFGDCREYVKKYILAFLLVIPAEAGIQLVGFYEDRT
ncbi:MAG TPA: polysaccharide deacetylase family protein, partial [Tahibacter sp.]|nr:polysaccharide deacetylase family protein [Tahibacter sp.]